MKPVLLILDVQNGIINRLQNTEPYLQRLASTVEAARRASIPIIYVVTSFRPGYPEIPGEHPYLASVVTRGDCINGNLSTRVHSAIEPVTHEVIITKHRPSAFHCTELQMILHAIRADHIIVAGLTTSGAVLSTVNYAINRDYHVTVLEDCCMDRSEEKHRLLMDMVFMDFANVVSAEQWVSSISSAQTTEN
ncbi:hypothetical protein N7535_005998 [Penicillium sp. DV-2018c]|nr:hypothetical protein N7461_009577 [Penicillium sp. DV-2018c]KAJ5572338.1 hypothetical protein N7535_005998 [Penicillium sp. DV-2018c]